MIKSNKGYLFKDREISWLYFNERVLQEAENPATPLMERIKFLAIFSSNLDEFFKTKLPNYKTQAAFYTLVEAQQSSELISPDQIVSNKYTILEHLTLGPVNQEKVKDEVLQEFQTYDKDVRMLTYKILLEKFNGKYSDLYKSQKEVLKEFITSVDSTPKLRTFYNNRIQQLKEELAAVSKNVTDKAVQIKLNEVLPLIVEIEKNQPIKNENIVDLLQYCELVEELKAANGQVNQ